MTGPPQRANQRARRGSVGQDASGRWYFVFDADPDNGRRRQIRRRGFDTRHDAYAAMYGGDDVVTMNRGGVIWVRKRDGTRVMFQPMNCNASPDIVDAIYDAIEAAYQRGRAETC